MRTILEKSGHEAIRVPVTDCGNGVYRIGEVEFGPRSEGGATDALVRDFFTDVLKCVHSRFGKTAQVAGWAGRVVQEDERIWLIAWCE